MRQNPHPCLWFNRFSVLNKLVGIDIWMVFAHPYPRGPLDLIISLRLLWLGGLFPMDRHYLHILIAIDQDSHPFLQVLP